MTPEEQLNKPPVAAEQKEGEADFEQFNTMLQGYASVEVTNANGEPESRNLMSDVAPLMSKLLEQNGKAPSPEASQEDVVKAFYESGIDITSNSSGFKDIAQRASRNISNPDEPEKRGLNLSTGTNETITTENYRNFDESPRAKLMNARDIIILASTAMRMQKLGMTDIANFKPETDEQMAAAEAFLNERQRIEKNAPDFLKQQMYKENEMLAEAGKANNKEATPTTPEQLAAKPETPKISAAEVQRKTLEARTPVQGQALFEHYKDAVLKKAKETEGGQMAALESLKDAAARFEAYSQKFPDLKADQYDPITGEIAEDPEVRMASFMKKAQNLEAKSGQTESQGAQARAETKEEINSPEFLNRLMKEGRLVKGGFNEKGAGIATYTLEDKKYKVIKGQAGTIVKPVSEQE